MIELKIALILTVLLLLLGWLLIIAIRFNIRYWSNVLSLNKKIAEKVINGVSEKQIDNKQDNKDYYANYKPEPEPVSFVELHNLIENPSNEKYPYYSCNYSNNKFRGFVIFSAHIKRIIARFKKLCQPKKNDTSARNTPE